MDDETNRKCVEDAARKEYEIRPGAVVAYEGKTFKVSSFDIILEIGKVYVWGRRLLDNNSYALDEELIGRLTDLLKGAVK